MHEHCLFWFVTLHIFLLILVWQLAHQLLHNGIPDASYCFRDHPAFYKLPPNPLFKNMSLAHILKLPLL